jgi:hypothetical protein
VREIAAASAGAPVPPTSAGPVLRARPERLRLWCAGIGVVIFLALVMVALLLPSSSDGTKFHSGDQFAVVGVGLALAGMVWLPTRPRLIADRDAAHVRSIVGGYKVVPWTLVRSVEFRPRWQWARLVLPADETISLYAVQRLDGARSVTTMRTLRELHAAAHDNSRPPAR